MIYVNWDDPTDGEPNVVSFNKWEEAEEFCKENKLNIRECCSEICW